MARQVMAGFGLNQRLAVCDALIDGASHDEARAVLRKLGVADEALPSDHSLNSYQESKEYQAQYEARLELYRMEHWELPTLPGAGQTHETTEQLAMRRLCMKMATNSLDTAQLLQLVRSIRGRESLALRRKQTELRETQMFADNVQGRARDAIVGQQGWAEDMMAITLEQIEAAQAADSEPADRKTEDNAGKPRISQDPPAPRPLPRMTPQAITEPENIGILLANTAGNLDRFAKSPPVRASA